MQADTATAVATGNIDHSISIRFAYTTAELLSWL